MSSYPLKIKSVIGYNGKVVDSLHYSADGRFVAYPLGPYIVVKNVDSNKECFLDGHTEAISCLKMSHNGRFLASGQSTLPAKQAALKVWDFEKAQELSDAGEIMAGQQCEIRTIMHHNGLVRDICFSCNDNYMLSIGGQDDNMVAMWRLSDFEAVCGGSAHKDTVLCCQFLNNREDRFVTAGDYHARVWQVDLLKMKVHVIDVKVGKVRRSFCCIAISPDDHLAFCGTETGDLLRLKIDRDEMRSYNDPDTVIPELAGASKDRLPQGILCARCYINPDTGKLQILVGGGDGTIGYMNSILKLDKDRRNKVLGGVTSLTQDPRSGDWMIGTDQCNRYSITDNMYNVAMLQSCHFGPVNQVIFPEGSADLLVTGSTGDLRVWHVPNAKELLRVKLPTLDCLSCAVTPTGSSIISGWSDGKVRSFAPESGKLKFSISDVHQGGITAIAIAGDDSYSSWKLITGGDDARVRIWKITSQHQVMLFSLKEHRGPINTLRVNTDETDVISASSDGSCIMWDLKKGVRTMAFFESNVTKGLAYHPDQSQILTCGTNCKITYWDAVDGEAIREIEGGNDFIQCLDVDHVGEYFLSGSGARERHIKIWHYDEGLPAAIGIGHSGGILDVKYSPDLSTIASVGSTGEIIIWEVPSPDILHQSVENLKADAESKL
jgi:cilia- and flagella-associated protein 52